MSTLYLYAVTVVVRTDSNDWETLLVEAGDAEKACRKAIRIRRRSCARHHLRVTALEERAQVSR